DAAIGVDLLGNVLLQGQSRHHRRWDVCKGQQLRPAKQLWPARRRIAEADVNGDVFERTTVDVSGQVVAYRDAFQQRVEFRRALNRKLKVIAEIDGLGQAKVRGCRLFVVVTAQVQFSSRAKGQPHSVVERYGALE